MNARAGDSAENGSRRAFLFQANPRFYDIDAAVRALGEMNWTVKQAHRLVHVGDRVYIWRAGPDRGVIATGTILTAPAMLPEQEGQEFIRNPAKFEGEQLRVRLSIDRVLDPPLVGPTLTDHPVLSDLGVFRFANATNYRLDPREDQALRALIGDSPAAPSLAERIEQWRQETGYPTERDLRMKGHREELAWALSEQNLNLVSKQPGRWDLIKFNQLAHKAYGDPGNQMTINRAIGESPETKQRVASALQRLLYGPGNEVERLTDVLENEQWRVRGLSESLTTKALAIRFPDSWLPLYQYDGRMGKISLMSSPELGLEVPADLEDRSLAERIVFTNDALRERLEPLIPGDPWGQMVFLYWLREQHEDGSAGNGHRPGGDHAEPPFEAIAAAIGAAGMSIDSRTLLRYHLSLKTRGFVILSGLSGSGKSWLAELYAEAVGARHLLVPVAPNWTTNEDLLGYLNSITDNFQHTELSLFVREAEEEWLEAERQDRTPCPFHVTLDEMNLARPEYYFARFLSAMEVRSRHGVARLELSPGQSVGLTPNLRVSGTVNVDETTHGFADKVFDRAQLLELCPSRDELNARLAGTPYRQILLEVWDAVHEIAPFAFRVLDEVAAYVAASEELRKGWEEPLDEQLLQKVLPKVRGANLAVGSSLKNLQAIAEGRLPLTHAKARAMHEGFVEHGFASFF